MQSCSIIDGKGDGKVYLSNITYTYSNTICDLIHTYNSAGEVEFDHDEKQLNLIVQKVRYLVFDLEVLECN